MIGPQDYPPEQATPYEEEIMQPLAQGQGVACFFAFHEDDVAGVCAQYQSGKGAALDPDPSLRAYEAILRQHSAREIAEPMGFKAVVT